MHFSLKRKHLAAILVTLTTLLLFAQGVLIVGSQRSDPIALSYQAFSQLDEKIYRSGGEAPELVAKLNLALGVIEEVQMKRAQGDPAAANRLEDNATSIIQSVLNAIPTAQGQAAARAASWNLTVLVLVPVVVILSTFVFFVSLRTWRYYERMKLYEMRIIEKKAED